MIKSIGLLEKNVKKLKYLQKKIFLLAKNSDMVVIVLYGLLITFFFSRSFFSTYMHGDFIAYWVTNYKFILDSLHAGTLPLWQPYSFLGLPEIFKIELLLFYPLIEVFLLVNYFFNPSTDLNVLGKSLEVVQYCNFFIGAAGMYFLLQRKFNLKIFPAFFGGIVFIFSTYSTIQAGDLSSLPGKLYLPWIAFLLVHFLQNGRFRNYLFLVCINIIIFSLGYPYNYLYFFFFQLSFSLFYGLRKTIYFGFVYVNALLIAGAFILPSLHVLTQSSRGAFSFADDPFFHLRYSYIPTKIINIFNPQLFGNLYDPKDPYLLFSMGMLGWGVIPLIFLITGFVAMKYDELRRWIVLVFILGLLVSLGGYLNVPQVIGTIIPPIEKMRTHAQALSLTFFAGVVILSHGVDATIRGYFNKKIMFALWQLVLFLVLGLMVLPFVCKHCTNDSLDVMVSYSRSIILLSVGLILTYVAYRTKRSIFIVISLVVTLFEFSFYADNIFYLREKTSYADYFRPNSLIVEKPTNANLFRYEFTDNQFNYNTSFLGIFNLQGYETVPYQAFYSLSKLGEEKIYKFSNTKYIVTPQVDKDKNIPGLKLIRVVDPKMLTNEVFIGSVGYAFTRQHDTKYYIYEVTDYLQRFFVPEKIQPCVGVDCYGVDADFSKVSYVKGEKITQANPRVKDTKIEVVSYTPNVVSLVATTSTKTFVASSEVWDKGWKVIINGKSATMYDVNNGFRGFVIPAGTSNVRMSYTPPYIFEGIFVSGAGWCLLIGVYFYIKQRKEKKK